MEHQLKIIPKYFKCMFMKKVSNNVHSRINNWRLDRMFCRSHINVYVPDK